MFEAPDSTLVVPLWSLMWSLMTLKAPPFTEAAQPGAGGARGRARLSAAGTGLRAARAPRDPPDRALIDDFHHIRCSTAPHRHALYAWVPPSRHVCVAEQGVYYLTYLTGGAHFREPGTGSSSGAHPTPPATKEHPKRLTSHTAQLESNSRAMGKLETLEKHSARNEPRYELSRFGGGIGGGQRGRNAG